MPEKISVREVQRAKITEKHFPIVKSGQGNPIINNMAAHRHSRSTTRKHRWRHLQASVRDTQILLREFRAPLFWFSFVVVGGGLLYDFLSTLLGEPVGNRA